LEKGGRGVSNGHTLKHTSNKRAVTCGGGVKIRKKRRFFSLFLPEDERGEKERERL